MAAYLSLKEKSTGTVYTGPKLIELDERICRELFGIEPDPKFWCHRWMGTIGFSLALGNTGIAENFENPDRKKIAQWLEDNFENTSYYGR